MNIEVESIVKTLMQKPDSCSDTDDYQYIKLSTADAGGGKYICVATEKWSVDSRDEWIKLWDNHIQCMIDS